MEVEKKSTRGLIIAIVLLVILVIVLGGYIGYDKFLNADTTSINEDNSKNKDKNGIENTENITDNGINNDQSLKFQYYVSKQQEDSSNSYRYSITLGESNDKYGFFSINLLNRFEGSVASGYYRIDNGKLILSFGPVVEGNNFEVEEGVFKTMNATLIDDPNQETSPNYKAYILNYNEDELQIGNYKLYRVK